MSIDLETRIVARNMSEIDFMACVYNALQDHHVNWIDTVKFARQVKAYGSSGTYKTKVQRQDGKTKLVINVDKVCSMSDIPRILDFVKSARIQAWCARFM